MEISLSQYRHIIWDWNGTLFDDAGLCVHIINGLLQRRGKPVLTHERYLEVFDFPVQEYYRKIGFDFAVEPFEKLAVEFMDAYDRGQFACKLQPGAEEVLTACRKRGQTQSILSAHHQPRLEEIVDFFSLRDFFVRIAGTDNYHGRSKLENGNGLIRDLGLDASSVLLVGDTLHDYEVAQAMGTDCLLISGGHQPRRKLASCGVCVLDSLSEILQTPHAKTQDRGKGETAI